MKVLEWSQLISHCKPVQIFYDGQGKLAPQTEVGSSLNSKSSKRLWLFLLPAKNEEDPIKNEDARVVTTMLHYPSFFKILKGSQLFNR